MIVKTVNGEATILQLQSRTGNVVRVWSTKIIADSIQIKEREKGRLNLFIKSMGKKNSKKGKKFHYDFRLKIF